jgi:hypothetical protein
MENSWALCWLACIGNMGTGTLGKYINDFRDFFLTQTHYYVTVQTGLLSPIPKKEDCL